MTGEVAAPPYEVLADIYDEWTDGTPYELWYDAIARWLRESAEPVRRVLDVCCGTGQMTGRLVDDGFEVTAVDGSESMIRRARERLGVSATLERRLLPDLPTGPFDAAVCSFDSVNYLAGDGELGRTLASVASALRPGGRFIVDTNSEHKLRDVFGSSHYGDVRERFGYVWRNRVDEKRKCVEFLITIYLEGADGLHTREDEHHVQRWFGREEFAEAARRSGFDVLRVTDDYTEAPVTAETLRESWVLVKR
jgi:SAM-dependent methyltransferase